MNLTIADPADLERIVWLVNDAYRGSSKTPGWTHEASLFAGQRIDVASLRASIEKDGATILVMRKDRDIVGCVSLQPLDEHESYCRSRSRPRSSDSRSRKSYHGRCRAIRAGAGRVADQDFGDQRARATYRVVRGLGYAANGRRRATP